MAFSRFRASVRGFLENVVSGPTRAMLADSPNGCKKAGPVFFNNVIEFVLQEESMIPTYLEMEERSTELSVALRTDDHHFPHQFLEDDAFAKVAKTMHLILVNNVAEYFVPGLLR